MTPESKGKRRSFLDPGRWSTWAWLVVLSLMAYYACVIVVIQLRLWRNGAIAAEVEEALHSRFPQARFRARCSYEREVIYVRLTAGEDAIDENEVERFLRALKAECRISPDILLKFVDDFEWNTAIKI